MRTYETTFIVNPQTDDATIDSQVGAISKLILDNGGNILNENRIGTRRLAYPIQKLTQGYYTSFVYEGTAKIIPILDHHFNLGEYYLRHLTIVYEGDPSPSSKEVNDQREKAAPVEKEAEEKSEATAETIDFQEEEKAEDAEPATEEPVVETSEEEEPKADEASETKEFNEDDQL